MNTNRFTLKLCVGLIAIALLIASFSGCSKLRSLVSEPTYNNTSPQESTVKPEAVAQFVSSVRPYQENVESIFKRARYFQENRKYRLAIQEFHAVVDIDPGHVEAYNGMGVCYDLLGDYERAVFCYKKALSIDPDLAHVENNLGYSYLLKGDLDASIEAFKRAIHLDSAEALYHNNLGLAYAEKGLFQPAFEEFALSGGEARAHYNLAQICLRKGLEAEAEGHLARAQSSVAPLSSGDPGSRHSVASVEASLSKTGDALGDWVSIEESRRLSSAGEGMSQTLQLPAYTRIEASSSSGMDQGPFSVQVASCRLRTNAERVERSLVSLGYPAMISETTGQDRWYVVRVGPFNDLNQAESVARELALIKGGHPILRAEAEAPEAAVSHGKIKGEEKRLEFSKTSESAVIDGARIEVSNGNGIRFMARDLSKYLGKRGYAVQKITNAETFGCEKTIIYYCDGYMAQAFRMAKELPGWNELKEVQRLRTPDIKIRLVIGKDLIPFREILDNV